ncbi:tetratricopeptide repeat protein [Burkholderia anthina]|uniref:Putative lipoprotein n=1 Tax=Burkholderia anthina TaxID=179879 RepID=A0A6P2GCH0_9BURK|nr:tetratricopeptide repeat protein [Burkholderia anthina]MBM2768338.1 sel1 repeat family protein [Burkholderia anthina]VVU50801.1 putative lipoprotein [Burkholderia anthina]
MPIVVIYRIVFAALALFAISVHAGELSSSTVKSTAAMSDLPRYEKLPLFNPHRKSFTCVYQNQHVPPVDPQAELWFQQALALDNPDVYYEKRDYLKIYQLYVQAADRGHWKAMLNLASLILSDYPGVPQHDPEAAIKWVEKAMQSGVPDAYDMMGTYHLNGLIKGGDATSAYAFFQRAADMGSPAAQAFLGFKMSGSYDSPDGEFWGNSTIGLEMLRCSLAQGYGEAAYDLGGLYKGTTPESKLQALKVLHDGVKLGCAKCAKDLASEFRGFDLTSGNNIVGHIDTARAQRYFMLGDALEHYKGRLKLPNLDKVLPLPPAPLPKWDGNAKTLIDAAKPVSPPAVLQKSSVGEGRSFVPDGHAVAALDSSAPAITGDQSVPRAGYWLALYGSSTQPDARLIARSGLPERYEAGERFEAPSYDWLSPDRVQWYYLGEAYRLPPQRTDFLANLIGAGLLREVSPSAGPRCAGDRGCPETGIWEGRVAVDHPMAVLYNRWDQQAFVEKGQAFPSAGSRFIDVAMRDVQWTYLGSPNTETGMPGIYAIGL